MPRCRKFTAIPTLLAAALAISLAACKQQEAPKPPPPQVGVITIKTQTVPYTYEAVGQTAGYREIDVRARVDGILLKRVYTEGKPVKEGQTLFQIDPAPFKAALDRALGAQAQSKASLEKATADRNRITPLFKENAVSKKDFDDANAGYDAAVANLAAATASTEEARINLGYTNVVAPISGMASKINFSEGSLVSPTTNGGLLTTIVQLDPLYANFSFSEAEKLALEKAAQRGSVTLPEDRSYQVSLKLADGSVFKHSGRIDFSDSKVDPATGTIKARAVIPNPEGDLLPGQFVRVVVNGAQLNNAMLIPQRAVIQFQADKAVLVLNDKNVVAPRVVQLGQERGNDFVVTSGLKNGDRVIVDGVLKARPGLPVHPVPAGASAPAVAAK
ncbi:efflux RND transporter periplasmic adaptor subunit [Jeongeupia sp. USM3]|uniref:efflux RND transporter periplasmic adaptor subunit n=1 Tax=Jeongeupia sp. USM3 TaxID=1906741 RepID=UPI00089E0650|nr:efflux RND transporter periplasmic adaptor subunit [Jeongeupia sp. USM3]AOX99449.1 efflux transporter periplasmic adaptor subunit [Jeongeupia sp. USM3]